MTRHAPTTDRPTTLNDDCTCPRVRHVHGTQSCYITCGCRCEPCVEAHRRAARERRAHAGTKPAPKKRPSGRGTYDPSMDYTITLRPVADPATARHVGAIVVAHATDKADARRLLDVLGLRELLEARP